MNHKDQKSINEPSLMDGSHFITKVGGIFMKNLIHALVQDPVTGKYGLMSSSRKHRPDAEDHFFELQKTTRFKHNPQELHIRKRSLRVKNPFKD
jgi:hypothetical protein